MNILFVDTETSGVPKNESKSFKDIDNWPSIRQIAWLIYSKDNKYLGGHNFEIGNTEKVNNKVGADCLPKIVSPIHKVLPLFINDLSECDVIIGHNIDYDVNVILCELYRLGLETSYLESIQRFCTMKNSVEACGFDTENGDRYPKLQELYTKLFHRPFENAHDAYFDIKATTDCFWDLFEDGWLDLGKYPFLLSAEKKQALAENYAKQADSIWRSPATMYFEHYHLINESNGTWLEGHRYHRFSKNNPMEIEMEELENKVFDAEWSIISGYYEKAINLYIDAANLGHVNSMARLGRIYYHRGDMNRAATWYLEAIEHGHEYLESYFECVKACAESKYYTKHCNSLFDKWAEICDKELKTIPDNMLCQYILAFIEGKYGQEKNLNKALEICEQALKYNRTFVREYMDELLDKKS